MTARFESRTGDESPVTGIDVGRYSAPSFADLDGDGDLDLLVGEPDGVLTYFENTGDASAPVFTARTGAASPFTGIDVGRYSTPSFADLDGDGDLDLLVGEEEGVLTYFENTGSAAAPVFTARTGDASPVTGIDVGFYSAPSFADLDGDGDLDLLVGELDGVLTYFENTGSAAAPVFTARTGDANPLTGIDVGSSSAPSFADLDGDGDLDLLFGEYDGVLTYFENTGDASAPVFTARTGDASPFTGIDVGFSSTPSFADLDGDGDLDLLVGELDGILNYYENTAPPAPEGPVATEGADDLTLTDGDDVIDLLGGNDRASGGDGNDEIRGGAGNDTIEGNAGEDRLFGDDGKDRLNGGSQNDELRGGEAKDRLYGGNGRDTLRGEKGNDKLFGDANADMLFGGGGQDRLNGGTGGDTLNGGAGDDVLNGGDQNDRLDGGTNDDVLNGGNGQDVFVFSSGHIGADRITDFQDDVDSIELSAALLNGESTAQAALDAYASVTDGNTVLDFGGGNTITLVGVTDTDTLVDDLSIV